MLDTYILKNTDLVILAGGKGTRIKNLLGKYPKPMVKINKKHFIQYVLNVSSKFNFKRIIILCGYRHKIFFQKFNNKTINLTKIICVKEKTLQGTGGALKILKKLNVKNFVLLNGDTIFNIDIHKFISKLSKNKIGIVALTKNKNQQSNKLNQLFLKKNLLYIRKKSPLMNGGIYFFKNKIFKYIPKKISSLENEILPKLIFKKKIMGCFFKNFFIDMGSKKFLKLADKMLIKEFKKPAIFLDRDGVINYDYGYVHKIKNFKFRPGVIKGLQYLKKKNYYIFVVTNQAGIGKKIYSEKQFIKLHKNINEKLKKYNIFIDEVQYSPYHEKAKVIKFRKKSNMRKPGNKMIKNIKSKWDLDLKKSFMVGDKISDKKAAEKSNLNFYYAKNNFFKQIKKIINNY